MIITLTGFMGCGKTSTGRALGALLSWNVVDLDAAVEGEVGAAVAEIFEKDGEAFFRAAEKKILKEMLSTKRENLVISLGGGTVKDSENVSLIRSFSECFYLKASAGSLAGWLQGEAELTRPLLRRDAGMSLEERISHLLKEREPLYFTVANHIVDVDNLTYGETAEEIRKILSI